MSKYKIVPLPPTWDMRMAAADAGIVDWRVDANGVPIEVGECTAEIVFEAMVNAAHAPVASAEDVERVAQVIHDAEKASFIRNGGAWIGSTPDGRHYEQARAALRAMGYEVKG